MNITLYLARVRRLTAGHKLALLIVASCTRARAPCQLRAAQWAVSLSCSKRWAVRILGDLEKGGWLNVQRRWRYYPNIYEPGPKLMRVFQRLKLDGGKGQ